MRRRARWLRIAFIASLPILLQACVSAPPRADVEITRALPPPSAGALTESHRRIGARLDGGESAFWLLDRADFSFEARLALVDEAVESLDIQYFIWEKDATSRLYSHRVLLAADRGVRVRLLLDDLTLNKQDGEFYALAQHPNVEVRTFNPWNARWSIGRVFEFLLRFGTLNRRMHNKIILADGRFVIIGGRNIGDRYFGVWEDFVQNDLDVLAAGPIVADVSTGFDDYWNSAAAYPLQAVISRRALSEELDEMRAFIEDFYLNASEKLERYPLEPQSWEEFLARIECTLSVGVGTMVQDSPDVAATKPTRLYEPMLQFIGAAQERVLVSSPYFVPDEALMAILEDLESRGVDVVVLTNSLASNNHMIAHSAYKRWRKRLLRMGVELFESRADSSAIDYYSTPPVEPEYLGLHSRAVVVDGRYSYVGSANMDPRSLELNTEVAFFMDSTELADRVTRLIERDVMPDAAWEVTLDERGRLRWTSSEGTVRAQPALGFGQRIAEFFISLLPIKRFT